MTTATPAISSSTSPVNENKKKQEQHKLSSNISNDDNNSKIKISSIDIESSSSSNSNSSSSGDNTKHASKVSFENSDRSTMNAIHEGVMENIGQSPSKRKQCDFLKTKSSFVWECICNFCRSPCGRHTPYKIGNCTVLIPFLFERTGFGMIGPHWIGLMFTYSIIAVLSLVNLSVSINRIGYGTAVTCCVFTLSCFLSLFMVSFRDPGIVLDKARRRYHRNDIGENSSQTVRYEGLATMSPDHDDDLDDEVADMNIAMPKVDKSHWKWCDMCKVFQPPTGAHCTICNVCIIGYDHHCPWMGCCVGENNLKAFAVFNVSWFFYALYAIFWISWISHYF